MSISVAIAHTPWVPERVESMGRLRTQLELMEGPRKEFTEKEPFSVWSKKMWGWSVLQDVTHCLFLQDDVKLMPGFERALQSMIIARPDDVIGLEVAHPAAMAIAEEGFNWCTTSDALVGVAYATTRTLLGEFLIWRHTALKSGALEAITEDSLFGLWCMVTGRKIWHPTPTIVDHDVALKSTYAELGNASHPNRRPVCRWDNFTSKESLTSTAAWLVRGGVQVPHLGHFYSMSPSLARMWVKDVSDADFKKWEGDNGAREYRRLNYLRRARAVLPARKIFIATPHTGSLRPEYNYSIWRALRDEDYDIVDPIEIQDVQQWGMDVARVRSRFVNHFLTNTDATDILFVDSDVEFLPKTIRGMLATGKDFIATPYPRRDVIDFERVKRVPENSAEGMAYRYSIRFLEGDLQVDDTHAAEVEAVSMGMTLISRECLQAMTDAYSKETLDFKALSQEYCDSDNYPYWREGDELAGFLSKVAALARANPVLAFEDESLSGPRFPSCALFQLQLNVGADWPSEDYSFCRRWRAMGGKIHIYLGDGSPVNHYGSWGFKGDIEAFGLRRIAK